MGGINLKWDIGENRDNQAKKEQANLRWQANREDKKRDDDLQLTKELLNQGYPADAAQYIVAKRNATGDLNLNLPTYTNAAMKGDNSSSVPPRGEENMESLYYDQQGGSPNRPVQLPPVTDIPERSTLMDFQPMKRDAIASIDPNNPRNMDFIPVPSNVSKIVHTVNKPSEANGQNIYINSATGDEIRRETNNSKQNKVIKVGSSTTSSKTSEKKTPAEESAMSYMKDYYKAVQNGTADPNDPILPSAAKTLGMDIAEIPTIENPTPPPNFIQKIFGITPPTPPPTQGKTYPVFPVKNGTNTSPPSASPYSTAEQVRADFQSGKIDRATAKKILQSQFGHK